MFRRDQSRSPSAHPVSVAVEFLLTRDPRLLDQYYQLRQTCFRNELGIPDFNGMEDEIDRRSHILLALHDDHCIGGARISCNLPSPTLLQELSLENAPLRICMWERFVIAPDARSEQRFRNFCASLIYVSQALGFQHALVLSSQRNARFYRKCHTALGVEFQVHRHVPECAADSFTGLEHYVSLARLEWRETLLPV